MCKVIIDMFVLDYKRPLFVRMSPLAIVLIIVMPVACSVSSFPIIYCCFYKRSEKTYIISLYRVGPLFKLANCIFLHQLMSPPSGSQCIQPSCLSVNWESYSLSSSFLSQTQPKCTTLCFNKTFVSIRWWEAFLSPHKVE